jgi:hypothetical protein
MVALALTSVALTTSIVDARARPKCFGQSAKQNEPPDCNQVHVVFGDAGVIGYRADRGSAGTEGPVAQVIVRRP